MSSPQVRAAGFGEDAGRCATTAAATATCSPRHRVLPLVWEDLDPDEAPETRRRLLALLAARSG